MSDTKRRMRSAPFNLNNKRKAVAQIALVPIALSTLAGCQQDASLDIRVYKDLDSCKTDSDSQIVGVCEAAYQKAVAEADRTSDKYKTKGACELEYGECSAMPYGLGFRPKMAAFMLSPLTEAVHQAYDFRSYDKVFYQPLFTSKSTYSENYGKLFFADGVRIGNYGRLDELSFVMTDTYLHPLPTQRINYSTNVDMEAVKADLSSGIQTGINNNGGGSVVNTLATAYIVSELIDEVGDASERRYRERMYNERLRREDDQRRLHHATITSPGYKAGKSSGVSKSNTYKSKPAVKTSSRGGWGSSSSAKSSWGS